MCCFSSSPNPCTCRGSVFARLASQPSIRSWTSSCVEEEMISVRTLAPARRSHRDLPEVRRSNRVSSSLHLIRGRSSFVYLLFLCVVDVESSVEPLHFFVWFHDRVCFFMSLASLTSLACSRVRHRDRERQREGTTGHVYLHSTTW